MKGYCEVCNERAWIIIKKVYFIRYRLCAGCFMDIYHLLPRAMWRPH